MMRVGVLLVSLFANLPVFATAKSPDCTNPDAWPAGMAFAQLKNAGLADNSTLDFSRTRVTRLASEKVGPDLYRQVHLIRFAKKSGEAISTITVNEASSQECSMSGVDVYVVSAKLGGMVESK